MYTSILHGLLTGFLFSLTPWFFFREEPLPNFFDAEAEADQLARRAEAAARAEDELRAAAHAAAMRPGHAHTTSGDTLEVPGASSPTSPSPAPSRESVSTRVSSSPLVGGELVGSVVFSKRMRVGLCLHRATAAGDGNNVRRDALTPDRDLPRHAHQHRVRRVAVPLCLSVSDDWGCS